MNCISKFRVTGKNLCRVVVTGLGVISPLGLNLSDSWSRLLTGTSAIQKLPDCYNNLPCRVAAPVDINLSQHFSQSELRSMSPSTSYALLAAQEALKSANWFPQSNQDLEETGVCVGIGMVDLEDICKTWGDFSQGYKRVSPFFVPRILPNMAAGLISIRFGFRGPNHSVSTACATGAHSIGDAYRFIKNGDCKVTLAGGAEKAITPLAIAGFSRLRALSTNFNSTPERASRPFDGKRDGFVMGDGAAILVLEELEHAKSRNAKIFAEILGYGLSGDASHLTAPREDGSGALLAMKKCLKDANLSPTDIGYINAHATSTPLGDSIEATAIRKLFPEKPWVSSTKGSHGHLLGSAGNLEAVFVIKACELGVIPPTINQEVEDEKCDVRIVRNSAEKWDGERRIALKNAFGFGGTNACLCIAQFVE